MNMKNYLLLAGLVFMKLMATSTVGFAEVPNYPGMCLETISDRYDKVNPSFITACGQIQNMFAAEVIRNFTKNFDGSMSVRSISAVGQCANPFCMRALNAMALKMNPTFDEIIAAAQINTESQRSCIELVVYRYTHAAGRLVLECAKGTEASTPNPVGG